MTNPTPPKPPADALPDVKALCERASFAFQLLTDDNYHSEAHVVSDLKAALERLAGEAGRQRQIIEVYEGTTRKLAQLETSLRSSEAALATLYHDWKEKCIEADTMRQHFKVAEELLAEARQLASVLSADLQDAQERLAAEEADHFYEEDKLTAELTALRANAGEDSKRLDWLSHPENYSSEVENAMGNIVKCVKLRKIIDAAMSATTPPASLASGGEKTL